MTLIIPTSVQGWYRGDSCWCSTTTTSPHTEMDLLTHYRHIQPLQPSKGTNEIKAHHCDSARKRTRGPHIGGTLRFANASTGAACLLEPLSTVRAAPLTLLRWYVGHGSHMGLGRAWKKKLHSWCGQRQRLTVFCLQATPQHNRWRDNRTLLTRTLPRFPRFQGRAIV